jgi:hypothetical protein
MVERITWPYTTADQNQLLLLYTDPFPFNTTNMPSMKYCLLDPRQSDPLDDLKLPSGYQDTGLVLPANETSCLIATTESVDAGGTGHFVAYVYSTIDGLRTSG